MNPQLLGGLVKKEKKNARFTAIQRQKQRDRHLPDPAAAAAAAASQTPPPS
jgi:hypothetical protein